MEVLGADLAYMGARFIACAQSRLSERLSEVGWTEERSASTGDVDFSDVHGEHKPWRDIFGAGPGVGAIDRVAPLAEVAEVAEEIVADYRASRLALAIA